MTAKSDLRDQQILIAIKKLIVKNKSKKCTIIDILEYCIEHFSKFDWSYLIIWRRIKQMDTITIYNKTNKNNYIFKDKTFKQNRKMMYITLRDNNDQ